MTENVSSSASNDIFVRGANALGNYTYDVNGNMITDSRKNLQFEYNLLNLPKEVKSGNVVKAKYVYTADGTKLQVRDGDATNGYDYAGSFVFKKNSSGLQLELINFSNGVIVPVGSSYQVNYFLRDHLGSTRAVVDGTGAVKEQSDYYAFGARQKRADYTVSENRYRYNGKELQTTGDLGYLDYGARMYMPEIGRWFGVDQLAEKYFSINPYAYVKNSPINAVDPNGKLVIFINGMHNGKEGGKPIYWKGFDNMAMKQLNDYNALYRDGSFGGYKSTRLNYTANTRKNFGYSQGITDAKNIIKSISDKNGDIKETIKIITHSMGGAYTKGYVEALMKELKDRGIDPNIIEFEADFAPFQPNKQKAVAGVDTYQFSHNNDWVAGNGKIPGAKSMNTDDDEKQGHSISNFMNQVQNLPTGKYKIENGKLIPY